MREKRPWMGKGKTGRKNHACIAERMRRFLHAWRQYDRQRKGEKKAADAMTDVM